MASQKSSSAEDFDVNNPDHQETWTEFLLAEPVKVMKTALHLSDDQRDKDGEIDWRLRHGSYAYWVGDEGVKAKINVVEPFISDGVSNVDLLNETNKLKVATEPNIKGGSFGFDFNQDSNKERKDLITAQSAIDLLGEGSSTVADVAHHYHSMSTDSFGVLADVRTGGLKRDLSQIFSLDQESSNAWKKTLPKTSFFVIVQAMKNTPCLMLRETSGMYLRMMQRLTIQTPYLPVLRGQCWQIFII